MHERNSERISGPVSAHGADAAAASLSSDYFGMHVFNPQGVRDIGPLVTDGNGRLSVVPARTYAMTTPEERGLFGVRHAAYCLPTLELVRFLCDFIGGRSAIEIGAGNGVLAEALGICATDSRQQERPSMRSYYAALGQPTITYGANVERLDAKEAIAKFRPDVVVATWVTHRYDPARHEAGGNIDGVLEEDVIDACGAYVFVGNEQVHQAKSIWSRSHEIIYPPWLFSRAWNRSRDFIAIWTNPDR